MRKSGDVIEHEGFQGPSRGHRDLNEEIIAAGDDEDGHDVVESGHQVPELLDGFSGFGLQPHGDDRLNAAPDTLEVDLGVVAGDDAAFLQPSDPVVAGRVGNAQLPRDLPVAAPRVCPERGENASIEPVKLHRIRVDGRRINGKLAIHPKGGLQSRAMNDPRMAADEIRTDLPTRRARLKWVVVADATLGPGLIVNAAVCMAAAVGHALPTLLGPGGEDAAGHYHPGLPWAGCSILAADAFAVRDIRAQAMAVEGVLVVDMPELAQRNRVYDEYLAELAGTDPAELTYLAVSLVGPRNSVDKLAGKLPLLGASPAVSVLDPLCSRLTRQRAMLDAVANCLSQAPWPEGPDWAWWVQERRRVLEMWLELRHPDHAAHPRRRVAG